MINSKKRHEAQYLKTQIRTVHSLARTHIGQMFAGVVGRTVIFNECGHSIADPPFDAMVLQINVTTSLSTQVNPVWIHGLWDTFSKILHSPKVKSVDIERDNVSFYDLGNFRRVISHPSGRSPLSHSTILQFVLCSTMVLLLLFIYFENKGFSVLNLLDLGIISNARNFFLKSFLK